MSTYNCCRQRVISAGGLRESWGHGAVGLGTRSHERLIEYESVCVYVSVSRYEIGKEEKNWRWPSASDEAHEAGCVVLVTLLTNTDLSPVFKLNDE